LHPRFAALMVKNLGRNPVRTALISLATMVLVAKVTLIWSVVHFLDRETRERSKDMKLIITERWQVPSLLPMKYADYLDPSSPSAQANASRSRASTSRGSASTSRSSAPCPRPATA